MIDIRHSVKQLSVRLNSVLKKEVFPHVTILTWAIFFGLLGSALVYFFLILLSGPNNAHVKAVLYALDVKTRKEALEFLGIIMGGLLLGLHAFISYRRAKALEDTVENTEKGMRQERLKNAIEHLGHTSNSVRMGGAHELFHLAQDTKELRKTVLDILCAHIRQTTNHKKYQANHKSKPSEEIQSLLNLLFVQDHDVFKGLNINLQESWLNGANLNRSKLEKANLSKAYLQSAKFNEANLREADLESAHLQKVDFTRARMQEARLLFADLQGAYISARMQGAVLHFARLQGALLGQAYLQGSDLTATEMQGADLSEAHMEGADLGNAHLEGTFLGRARMQAANLNGTNFRGATCLDRKNVTRFVENIRKLTDERSELSGVLFSGGLSKKDTDSLVAGLSVNLSTKLRTKLHPHIAKPVSHELPEKSGAITGYYTKEEAEQWIAKYTKAVSGGSEEDNS